MVPEDSWVYGIEMGEVGDQPCYLGLWATRQAPPGQPPYQGVQFMECDGEVNQGSVAALGFEKARNQEAWNRVRDLVNHQLFLIPVWTEMAATSLLFTTAFDGSNPAPPLPTVNDIPMALDGLGICQRNSNDELKGLRIYGSTLDLTHRRIRTAPIVTDSDRTMGTVTIPAGSRINTSFERPNCSSNNGGWQPIQTCGPHEVIVGVDIHYKFPGITGNQNRARITGLAPKCARVTIERG